MAEFERAPKPPRAVLQDDMAFQLLALEDDTRLGSTLHAAEQQSVLAEVLDRVNEIAADLITPRLLSEAGEPSLWCAVTAGGQLQALYAAAGPASEQGSGTRWIHLASGERSPQLDAFFSGEALLLAQPTDATAGADDAPFDAKYMLPVFGFDGRPALLVEWGGVVQQHGSASALERTAVAARLRAAVGHSGLLELNATILHPPAVYRHL